METAPLTAAQSLYRAFITDPTTSVPAKRCFSAYVVDTQLDHARLTAAIAQVIARHDSLRSGVTTAGGVVMARVLAPGEVSDVPVRAVRWDGTSAHTAALLAELDSHFTTYRSLPLVVVHGYCGGKDNGRSLVLCAFDHTFNDGISSENVFDEVRRIYDDPSCEIGTAVQFRSYVAGMIEDGEAVVGQWERVVSGARPAVPEKLTTRPTYAPVRRDTLSWRLPADLVDDVRFAARRARCTLFELLHTAVAVYFRRPDDAPAAIGVIHSGRHRPGGLGVVGLLRSHVVDASGELAGRTVGAVVDECRTGLRWALGTLSRLPFEEFCARTGRSAGWWANASGQWEVEVNGIYVRSAFGTMGGATVRPADVPLSEETVCDNGGPLLIFAFLMGTSGVGIKLRYLSPVSGDLAAAAMRGIVRAIRYMTGPVGVLVGDCPAFYRTVQTGSVFD